MKDYSRLKNQLRGIQKLAVKCGGLPVGAYEITRQHRTSSLQVEAAGAIEALEEEIKALKAKGKDRGEAER